MSSQVLSVVRGLKVKCFRLVSVSALVVVVAGSLALPAAAEPAQERGSASGRWGIELLVNWFSGLVDHFTAANHYRLDPNGNELDVQDPGDGTPPATAAATANDPAVGDF